MSNVNPPPIIWLRLKLDLLPIISQEVDKVSKDYYTLVEEARNGDKESYQKLIFLQNEVRNRIDEFDRFYEKNYADFRIPYFEKLKLRLRKLLSNNIDINVFIQEEQRNLAKKYEERAKSPGPSSRTKMTSPSRNDFKASPLSSRPVTSPVQAQHKPASKSNIKQKKIAEPLLNNKKQAAPTTTNPSPPPPPSASPNRGAGMKSARTVTPNKKTPSKTGEITSNSKKVGKNPEEVVFTIKMTKEEYLQYMAAKNKKK